MTTNITVDGYAQLMNALVAKGYDGSPRPTETVVLNNSEDVAYLFVSDSGEVRPGTAQIVTAEVVGTITTSGDSEWVVTAGGMDNSPVTVVVALEEDDTAEVIAAKARTALAADEDVSSFFTVIPGDDEFVSLRAITPATNDETMNIAYADDTSEGLTDDATSTITVEGNDPATEGLPLSTDTAEAPSSTFTLPKGTDLNTVWLYTTAEQDFIVSVNA